MSYLQFLPFPEIETERLLLRQIRPSDAENLQLLRSIDSVNQYINRPDTMTLEDAQSFVERAERALEENKYLYWTLAEKQNEPKLIGTLCLWNFDEGREMAEVGYELHPDFHGKGIMSEALKVLLDFAFRQLELKIVTAWVNPSNGKSIQLLERFGFQLDEECVFFSKKEIKESIVYYLEVGTKNTVSKSRLQ